MPRLLRQGQAEQALDVQAERDGGGGEDPLASSLAAGRRAPRHAFVQPDRQRPSGFERGVVRGPVGGLVARLGALGFCHATRLPACGARFVQQSPCHLLQRVNLSRAQSPAQNVALALLSAFVHLHSHFWWLLYSDHLGKQPEIFSRLYMVT
jgi:hypothetical protein